MYNQLILGILLLLLNLRSEGNLAGWLLISSSFFLTQWWTSFRILRFSSSQFMQENKRLLLSYNILTLNILGICLVNKFIKDGEYNCADLIEKTNVLNDESDIKEYINKVIHYYRMLTILVSVVCIIFAFSYIWAYKYMKYLNTHKTEWINVRRYNNLLFWF